ncbi:13244_t:CDS:2 [Ambispora gerdemannii]|uniref:13244_t:CDS:1 n=1 Tax=Ambispora gerdemannii TaxID=144530 RepID=A0A9N9FL19_9GLOM|nr:13244_t:CDS:2 [Ambispora gerdemannii]
MSSKSSHRDERRKKEQRRKKEKSSSRTHSHQNNKKGRGLASDLNNIEDEYSVEKEEWFNLLFEEMAYDEGDQFWSGHFFEQWETGESYINDHDGLHQMTEDEYAAYMRQGMYERQNAQEIKEERDRQEARQRKEKKRERERARILAGEEERELKRREKVERRYREKIKKKRELYFSMWKSFDVDAYSTIKEEIIGFLFDNDDANINELDRRRILRQEQIKFHPDRWHRWIAKMQPEQEKNKILDRVNRISQILNALWDEVAEKEKS